MPNINEAEAYSLGLTNGCKHILLKLQKRIRTKNAMLRPFLIDEFNQLIAEINEMPTIEEKGKFEIDPVTDNITFIKKD